ncbi:MAG: winged helix-turn-helix transcriptional regulator [Clostridiales bacterium]|nr:winged helix-turn-helix transcriptional regulator [Clostridiales bacterium]
MLNKKQFDILCALENEGDSATQRQIASATGLSLGSVNKSISELTDAGLATRSAITDAGIAALEPYRVKRAIFVAAGFGSRLMPITLNTPKPLIRVNGTRIIDTMLDAVYAAGISEVYIVRGYLSEQFDQLLYKYPDIKFIENKNYNESNNISSIMCVKDILANAYIMESDLFLNESSLISKYQYSTNYLGVPVKRTDDWCFKKRGSFVSGFSLGGIDCYHMYGISYWSEADAKRLSADLEKAYNSPGGHELFWDQVPLQQHLDDYKIMIRECSLDSLNEIDTYRELINLDPSYKR